MNRLENKVAVITGGMKGIGFAAARVFVAQGAKVLLVDMEESVLQQAVRTLGYRANSYARNLRAAQSRIIAVYFSNPSRNYTSEIQIGVLQRVAQQHHRVTALQKIFHHR